jgi:hypothetical protein
MQEITIRKYAIIEKVMHLKEEELQQLEASLQEILTEVEANSVEQYNSELEDADAAIDRGEYIPHEEAVQRLKRWRKDD